MVSCLARNPPLSCDPRIQSWVQHMASLILFFAIWIQSIRSHLFQHPLKYYVPKHNSPFPTDSLPSNLPTTIWYAVLTTQTERMPHHFLHPWGQHPSAETCRSFNNCHELYFITLICLWIFWFSVRLISNSSCAHSDRRIFCQWAHVTYIKSDHTFLIKNPGQDSNRGLVNQNDDIWSNYCLICCIIKYKKLNYIRISWW